MSGALKPNGGMQIARHSLAAPKSLLPIPASHQASLFPPVSEAAVAAGSAALRGVSPSRFFFLSNEQLLSTTMTDAPSSEGFGLLSDDEAKCILSALPTSELYDVRRCSQRAATGEGGGCGTAARTSVVHTHCLT